MSPESPPSITAKQAVLSRKLETIEYRYKFEDPANRTIGVFAEALRTGLSEFPYVRELADTMLTEQPKISAAYAAMRLLRGYQADAIEHDSSYPESYDMPEKWFELFKAVEDDDMRWAIVRNNICNRDIQSNVAQRYKSVKLLAHLLADRFDGPPSHLDVGCSIGHGNRMLSQDDSDDPYRLAFGAVDVMANISRNPRYDHEASVAVNGLLRLRRQFGSLMDTDIQNVDDPVCHRWAESCSMYPDERKNPRRMGEFSRLEATDPDHRSQFYRGDFAKPGFWHEIRAFGPSDGYDIVTFSTIFYQVSKQEQHAMILNALNLVSRNGIIVIQDAPDGDFTKKWNYFTSVIDGSETGIKPQQLIRWENGRCDRAVLKLGETSVHGAQKTMRKSILHSYQHTIAA